MSTLLHLPYVLLDLFTFFPSTEIDGATYPTAGRHAFVTVALQQLVDQRKEIRKRLPAPLAGRHPNKAETSHDSGPGETLHDARSCDLKTVKNLHEETECVYIYIYLSFLLNILCTNSAVVLKVPPTHIKAFRDRAFAKVAPLICDNLRSQSDNMTLSRCLKYGIFLK